MSGENNGDVVPLSELDKKNERKARIRRIVRSPLFEPIVAVAIIVVLVASLYAYTGVWPPMVVVESESMQHGYSDVLGIINTGDIVLVKQVSDPENVTTYVDGEVDGFTQYGEYGNVLLYYPNGNTAMTPVIHRAMVYLQYDGSSGYEMPSVYALQCSPVSHEQYQLVSPSGVKGCLNSPYEATLGTLNLYNVGWQGVLVSIDLENIYDNQGDGVYNERYSGYITMGDNNIVYATSPGTVSTGEYDQSGGCVISCLVQPGWIEGVARGMIPWFGALKLWLDGDSQDVPSQTWDYLALTIVAIIVLPQVLPWGYRQLRKKPRAQREPKDQEGSSEKDDQQDRS